MRVILLMGLLLVSACNPTKLKLPEVGRGELDRETAIQQEESATYQLKKQQRQVRKRLKLEQRLHEVGEKIQHAGLELCHAFGAQQDVCVYPMEYYYHPFLINAWADGNSITVTSRMIEFAKPDVYLAFVLAHEYAHNLLEHPQSSTWRAHLGGAIGAAADALARSEGIYTGGQFEDIGFEAGKLNYSQEMEYEADYLGLYILARAGYAIEEAPAFWRKMSERHPDAVYLASSHPTNPARFVALEHAIKEIKAKQAAGKALVPERQEAVATSSSAPRTSSRGPASRDVRKRVFTGR